MERPFIGPFKVINVCNEVTYKFDLKKLTIHNVFHVSKLQTFKGIPTLIDYLNGEYEILLEAAQHTKSTTPSPPRYFPKLRNSADKKFPTGFSSIPKYDPEPVVKVTSATNALRDKDDDDLDHYPFKEEHPIEKIFRCRIRRDPSFSSQARFEHLVLYKVCPEYERSWV